MPATEPLHNRLAVVFDYDDTLAPDSYTQLLEHLGHERDAFTEERVTPLEEDGWDHIMARFYALIEESRRRKQSGDAPITRDMLRELGEATTFFDGVPALFNRVRERAEAACPGVEVEFYLLSSGIIEIARASTIAEEFNAMWGCAFAFDESEEIHLLKRALNHPEKVRYLLHLSKDGRAEPDVEPAGVYGPVAHGERHIPLDQVVFLGDGASDMPAFRLMQEEGGTGIGIFLESDGEWDGGTQPGRRVQNLAPADYSEGSELMRSLLSAVDSIGKRIALRKLGRGE
jgi:hypothetical protein